MDDARRSQNRRPRFAGRLWARLQRGDAVAAMDLTTTWFLILLGCVGLERLAELQVSRRHQRELAPCGARKQSDPQYRWMVALHAGVLIGAALEVTLLHRPFIAPMPTAARPTFPQDTMLRVR